MVIAGLVEHPEIGLVLFETGCTENVETVSFFNTMQGIKEGQTTNTPP